MNAELSRWNAGQGISLEGWIGCTGSFDLAVGYCTVFWPTFMVIDRYLLTEGCSPETIRGFESQPNSTPKNVEWVLNHLHLLDIHAHDEVCATPDRLLALGNILKNIYAAKLLWQFPDRPCEVVFYIPENQGDLLEYQISFWQKKWDIG
jgi:hypothetical protein